MTHDPRRPAPSDDELGRTLSAGLGRAVEGGVDTGALLAGAHAGARRIRRRRTAVRGAVVAVCAAAVVPFGYSLFVGEGGVTTAANSADSAAQSAEEGVAGAAPKAEPPGTVPLQESGDAASSKSPGGEERTGAQDSSPMSVGAGPLDRDASGSVVVPDEAVLSAEEFGLPTPVTRAEDVATTSAPATVVTVCPGATAGEQQVAGGRLVRWAGSRDGGSPWSVATVVEVFSGDGAKVRFDALDRAVGTCSEASGVVRERADGALPGDGALLAVLPGDGTGDVRAVGVVRVGRTTAGVLLVVPSTVGADDAARRSLAVDRARALLAVAAGRLGPLAAQAAADPSLG